VIWTWSSIRYRGGWRTFGAAVRALIGVTVQAPAAVFLDLAAGDGSVILLQAGTSDLMLAAGDGGNVDVLAGGA